MIEPEAGPTSLDRTVTAGNPIRNTAIQIQNCKNTEILNTEMPNTIELVARPPPLSWPYSVTAAKSSCHPNSADFPSPPLKAALNIRNFQKIFETFVAAACLYKFRD